MISQVHFVSLYADEVTAVDHQSWLSIHCYVCLQFKRVHILLSLSRSDEENTANAVGRAIQEMVVHHTGINDITLVARIVCLGTDGDSLFQGCRNRVTVNMKAHVAPFMFGVQCIAHRTNLDVKPLSNLPIVAKLEGLCQAMFSYFSQDRNAIWSFKDSPKLSK
jgi:hypothetical protein